MGAIFAIVRKDTLVRFAHRSEWLFFLILPLGFTYVIGGGYNFAGDQDPRLPLPVVDQDGGPLAAALMSDLEESSTLRPSAATFDEATAALEDDEVAAVLLIPSGFSQALTRGEGGELQLLASPSDINALAIGQAVRASAARVSLPLAAARLSLDQAESRRPFTGSAERDAYLAQGLTLAQQAAARSPQRLELSRSESATTEGSYSQQAQASAGGLITWVFIPLLGISGLFAYERSNGTLRRLVSTPTSRPTYLLGTISGQSVTALVQIALLVAFGAGLLRVPWGRDPAALLVLMLAFVLCSAALGTTLGTFVRSEAQASGLSIMLGMVLSLLGGCWYPVELFPQTVRTAVQIFPTTWAMRAMTDLTMRGQSMEGIALEVAVLLGFAVVFFAVGVLRFRYE